VGLSDEDVEEHRRPPNPPLYVRHLERLPLGTPYPAVVERVKEFARTPPLSQFPTCLVADRTGVGAGVIYMFVHAGLTPVSVTIHDGSEVGKDFYRHDYRVSKRDLVSTVQAHPFLLLIDPRRSLHEDRVYLITTGIDGHRGKLGHILAT
jgi:hypothetical protein